MRQNPSHHERPLVLLVLTSSLLLLSPAAAAMPNPSPVASLRYLGPGADYVGRTANQAPDGEDDTVFELRMHSPGRRTLSSMSLRLCNSRGVGIGTRIWAAPTAGQWALGVVVGTRLLRPSMNVVLDRVGGDAVYRLHAAPPLGGFRIEREYCAFVTFTDGTGIWAKTVIPTPVKVKLSFVGMERDEVGRGQVITPDGTVDAHFALDVDSGTREAVLTSIVLARIDADGQMIGGKVWDTRPNDISVLGVVKNGRRLNPRDIDLRDRMHGKARYSLFFAPREPLVNGTLYKVVVRHERGVSVAMTALAHPRLPTPRRVATAPHRRTPPRRPASLDVTYQGFREDKVGAGRLPAPDGRSDARFELRLEPRGRRLEIQGMELSVSDAHGVTWRKTWDTKGGAHWPLAVAIGKYRLDQRLRTRSVVIDKPAIIHLWASEDFWTDRNGQRISYYSRGAFFTVRVYFKNHSMVRRTVRLR